MRERIKQITRNQFLKNVSTLAAGTVISQAVVIGTSPVLSRLFAASSFGTYAVFSSVAVFFAVLSTGRYELALGLPDEDKKAARILKLIFGIGGAISLFYLLLIFFLKDVIHLQLRSDFLKSNTAYLAPLYIFFIAIYSGLGYWLQRRKHYKKITVANAVQVIGGSVFSVIFGLMHISSGLIVAMIIGVIFSVLYIFLTERGLVSEVWNAAGIGKIAREYKSFPRYMIFSDLSLTASQQFIPVLFSALFSSTVVGLYSMANRMIRLPNIVITAAIGNVFRNDAIEQIRERGSCRELYAATFKKLVLMSLPIYFLVFLLSPMIFRIFLGEQWTQAGIYARILSVMLLFEFVAVPLSTVFYIREKQKLYARLQFANACLGALAIFAGYKLIGTVSGSLYFFVSVSVLFNCFLIYFSYKFSSDA